MILPQVRPDFRKQSLKRIVRLHWIMSIGVTILIAFLVTHAAIGQSVPRNQFANEMQDESQGFRSTRTNNVHPRPKANTEMQADFTRPRLGAREDDTELTRLRKQRLKSAAALAVVQRARYLAKSGTLDAFADSLDRLLQAYLSLAETDEHRAEVFANLWNHLLDLDRFSQTRLEVGMGTVAEAAHARSLTLHAVIPMRRSEAGFAASKAIGGRLTPLRLFADNQNAVTELKIDRPDLKLNESLKDFSKTIPAIVQPHPLIHCNSPGAIPQWRPLLCGHRVIRWAMAPCLPRFRRWRHFCTQSWLLKTTRKKTPASPRRSSHILEAAC